MDKYTNKPWQDVPLINSRERFNIKTNKTLEPKVDMVVSKIVGRQILQRDPRLLKLIVKWKSEKKAGDDTPDNFFQDPKKIEELKKVLNSDI